MFCRSFAGIASLVVCAALTLPGCGRNPAQKDAAQTSPPAKGEGHAHGHAHPSKGPNRGNLVELGNDEYHAEVVHGDGGAVTVYILDGTAKNVVPIEATEIVINVTHEGKPEQTSLPATPEESDGQGKSSKFSVTSTKLASHLEDEKSAARLVVTIAGKQYTGKIEHGHDHHGHDHK